jgi:cobalt-zinc-cadmium efflux system outer membrane protein
MCNECDMAGPWGSIVVLGALWGPPAAQPVTDPMVGGAAPAEHDHRTDAGPAIAFEEALGHSASTPELEGLEAAGEVKRAIDRGIPRVVYGPQVNVMTGARVTPEPNRGFEVQVTATQAWSLEGYGPKRHAAAAATSDVLDVQTRALALERRLAAAHAWIQLHAAELELALARQELALARARVERMTAGRVAGVSTRMHEAEASTDAAELQALATELAGLVHDLGLVLARETGAAAEHPLRTHGPHPEPLLPGDDELRRYFSAVDRLPAVVVERLRARALRAVAVEEQASRGHQAHAGLAIQREATTDVVLFGVVGMSFAGDRGQRHRGMVAAEAREAEGRSEQRALELQAALSTVLHDLHHARERVEILRDRVLPAFDELEAAQSIAVDLGEGTEPELLLARRRRIAVARRLVEAEAELVWARVQAWLYLEAFVAAGVDPAKEGS